MKGLEISLKKKYGKYFRGFLKYNLSGGYYKGWGTDDIPIRPKNSFRFLLTFNSSDDWGKVFKNITASILYTREGGTYFSFDPEADNPFEPSNPAYINNLKWKDEAYLNLLLNKDMSARGFAFSLYAEVNNLFDSKYISNDNCFRGGPKGADKLEYLRSLRLPMYNEERYASDDLLVGGNDKVGEVEKDYIDKPDFEYLYYTNPRFLRLGMRVDF
jgi:outer membrane receptor protein involved in Fe transport